jgi:hypothetical protein
MSAVLQPTDTPSTVGTAGRADAAPAIHDPKTHDAKQGDEPPKKKKTDPVEAAKRLAESRERMRQWMLDPDGRHEARRRRLAAGEATGEGLSMFDRLRSHPVVGVGAEMLNTWWTRHPLHPVAGMAQGAVRDHLVPVVRRHPIAVVAGSFAVGALLVWFKPWRFLAGTARSLGSASHLVTKLIGGLPIASLLAAFAAVAKHQTDEDDGDREANEAEEAAQRAEVLAQEEALAPLAGMPDPPSRAAERTTVH